MKRTAILVSSVLLAVFIYSADSWGQADDIQMVCKDVPADATMVKCSEKCECTWCGDGKVAGDEFCDIGDKESCGRGRVCKTCTECVSGVMEETIPTDAQPNNVNPAELFQGTN